MGPTMNLLLAFVLTAVVLYQGGEILTYQDQPPVVGVVTAGSPASKIDIQPGDRIMSVADHNASTPGSSSTSPSDRAPIARRRSGCCATVSSSHAR